MVTTGTGDEPLEPVSETSTLTPSDQDIALGSAEKGISHIPQDKESVRPIHGWRWIALCGTMYITAFMYGLDTTIAANIQPGIIKSLGMEAYKLTWIGVGFPLGSVAVILPLGFAYSLFEMKLLFLGSVIIFEGGSALCGGAPTMDAEIVGRVIAGIGGAGMYLGTLNYISVFTTVRERSTYNAIIGVFWGVGCICGPLIGGGFAVSSIGWRWSFYINLLVAAALAPFLIFFIPSYQPAPNETFASKIKSVDWLGAFLSIGSQVAYTLALVFGGTQWAWSSYKFAVSIGFFGATLIAFIASQYFHPFVTKSQRIFACQFLTSRTMMLLNITTASGTATMFIATYYIPLYFQTVRGDSAIMSAVRLLPFLVITIFLYMVNGALMPVFGYYQPWFIIAGIFQIIGGALWYTTVDANTSAGKIYGYSVILAIGCCANQAGYAIAAAKTTAKDPRQVPAAIAFINIAQIGTIVLALTIAGSIFQNYAYTHIKQAIALFAGDYNDTEIRSALIGILAKVYDQWSDKEREAVLMAIVSAMNNVFIMVIVAGAVILLCGLSMKWEKLFVKEVADRRETSATKPAALET